MIAWSNGISFQFARTFAILTIFASLAFTGVRVAADDVPKPWVAPDDARAAKNPVPATPESLAAADTIYQDSCALCHGPKGAGDGPGGKSFKVKPTNFTEKDLMGAETDGSLFWKISEGRGPMPPWKDVLTGKERWQLINYIRKLASDAEKK